MKIVFFGYGMLELGGGFENYLIDTAKSLCLQYPDCEIDVVTASDKLTEKYYSVINRLTLQKYDKKSLYRESAESIQKRLQPASYKKFDSINELRNIMKQANVIYTKNEIIELYMLQRIGLKNISPVIVGAHTPVKYGITPTFNTRLHNLLYTSKIYKRLLKNVAAIKVNNRDDCQYIKNQFNINNVGVLHHGFPVSKVIPKYSKQGQLNVMFAGRLTEAKGVDILSSVIKEVSRCEASEKVFFKIAGIGNPNEQTIVENLSKEFKNVTYLGHVPQVEMKKVYQWADVALIPSKFETLNKIAVEAGINGKIAIASDIPGPREVIKHGKTGYLVKPTSDKFFKKLFEVRDKKDTDLNALKQMGRAAQIKIENEFSIKSTNQTLYETFKFLGGK